MMDPHLRYGPKDLDVTVPSSARAYDYYLGGSHNFEVDRSFAERVESVMPYVRSIAGYNRSFLWRVVRYLCSQGIHQFLDLGSGIPTVGNVHEIAQDHDPTARVVYVDYEPLAYQYAWELLRDNPNATIIQADIRDPDVIRNHAETQRMLDFSRPIGLLLVGILLYIPDSDDPAGLVRRYREFLPPGSYLAASHISDDQAPAELAERLARLVSTYEDATDQVIVRDRDTFAGWFPDLELVPPGVVPLPQWRPDQPEDPEDPARPLAGYGLVGRVG